MWGVSKLNSFIISCLACLACLAINRCDSPSHLGAAFPSLLFVIISVFILAKSGVEGSRVLRSSLSFIWVKVGSGVRTVVVDYATLVSNESARPRSTDL